MLLIQPTGEISKQIQVELNENPATRDKDLEAMKEWFAKQPHLPQTFDGNAHIWKYTISKLENQFFISLLSRVTLVISIQTTK